MIIILITAPIPGYGATYNAGKGVKSKNLICIVHRTTQTIE